METKKRIEWIDAMRGFTMLLVVYAHVQSFGLNLNVDETFTFNRIFYLFRMPLFFFISGFILYKATAIWDWANTWAFLKKKFVVQIIPTTFFILVFAACFHTKLGNIFFSDMKYGYWFTYTLLEFFIVYTVLQNVIHLLNLKKCEDFILIAVAIGMFVVRSDRFIGIFNHDFAQFVGVKHWLYYFYFTFGCLVKKYFGTFQRLLDSKYFLPMVQLTFLAACIYIVNGSHFDKILRIYIALTGIVVVVAFFRKYEASFTQERRLGRCLQYVGRRTLDVYLLHYFFLPRGLNINKYEWGG